MWTTVPFCSVRTVRVDVPTDDPKTFILRPRLSPPAIWDLSCTTHMLAVHLVSHLNRIDFMLVKWVFNRHMRSLSLSLQLSRHFCWLDTVLFCVFNNVDKPEFPVQQSSVKSHLASSVACALTLRLFNDFILLILSPQGWIYQINSRRSSILKSCPWALPLRLPRVLARV